MLHIISLCQHVDKSLNTNRHSRKLTFIDSNSLFFLNKYIYKMRNSKMEKAKSSCSGADPGTEKDDGKTKFYFFVTKFYFFWRNFIFFCDEILFFLTKFYFFWRNFIFLWRNFIFFDEMLFFLVSKFMFLVSKFKVLRFCVSDEILHFWGSDEILGNAKFRH